MDTNYHTALERHHKATVSTSGYEELTAHEQIGDCELRAEAPNMMDLVAVDDLEIAFTL